jgi:protocatechuate 3,4-dioxygenase beta subunit
MKNCIKLAIGLFIAALLAACGGGGGSAGGTSTGGSGGSSQTATLVIDILGGSGASTSSITTVEIATARATLRDARGAGVPNVIVTFSETAGSLLTFAPASKTALTDSNGVATVEVRAASTSNLGATSIDASALVNGVTLSSQKSIALASVPPGAGTDPQTLASALNFLDVNPADRSIVLAGTGGNGRSESATLRFRVVDRNNSPVKGVNVDFVVVPANDVVLNILSAASDAEGVVATTVSSKSVATAVVVRATVRARSITSQSDQLLVTTGAATQAGFDLSASKYNLNRGLTGDSSEITVRIRDTNGNPVADGVPVVFTADFGVVGSSSRGGCTTLGGFCNVTYLVQEPRPPDGVLAKVTASTRLGDGTTISDVIQLQMSDPANLSLFTASTGGTLVAGFDMSTSPKSCKQTFQAFVGTPGGAAAPAQTAVATTPLTTGLAAVVKSGTPILDTLTLGRRTLLAIEVDASTLNCDVAGTNTGTASFIVKFTSGTIAGEILIDVTYPTI